MIEWILVALVAAGGLIPLLAGSRSWPLAGAVAFLLVTGCVTWQWAEERRSAEDALFARTTPRPREDEGYVSSDTCQACHPGEYASWHRTFHRTMTQRATPETVVGDFDDVSLDFDGRTYRLERRGDEFWVEMVDPNWEWDRMGGKRVPLDGIPDVPRVWQRVVMTTGSHHQQVYWTPGIVPNQLNFFPFVYLIPERRWIPRRESFLKHPSFVETLSLWNVTCIQCHSTAGQPRPEHEVKGLDTRVAELGIACEACHGPAGAHVEANRDPLRRYRRRLAGEGDPTIVNPKRVAHDRSSQICGACHGMGILLDTIDYLDHGSRYRPGADLELTKHTVQPARPESMARIAGLLAEEPDALRFRFWSDGMVRISGREYNGVAASPCFERGELSCLSCHSMHNSDPVDQLAPGREGDEACLQCHTDLREKIAEHTHHAPESSGSRCYNCHMPHTTYGLLKAIRSHQIDSPTVQSSLATGRPNACNLCHLDQSLGWTQDHLAEWYGTPRVELAEDQKTISAAVQWLLRGDGGQRALIAWSMGWEPARRASGDDWLAPMLAEVLDDPYSAVRFIAGRSLRAVPGHADVAYDFLAPSRERRRVSRRILEAWERGHAARPGRTGRAILILPDGRLDRGAVARLRKARVDRPLRLLE